MVNKVFFRAREEVSHGYRHLYIELWDSKMTVCGDQQPNGVTAKLSWQSSQDINDWYGFSIKTETASLYGLREASRVVSRVMSKLDGYCPQPELVVEKLRKIKAAEMVWDGREGALVPLAEVKDSSYRAYRDDWQALGKRHCTAGCMARNETEAKSLIGSELATNPRYEETLLAWLERGRPVRQLDDRAPDTETVEEKIRL